ncbi:MAG: ankyrin repeat domain-containing protein [Thermodesulfovibrionales bacterium]|jgi:hypothetical protein|nr:ankyrin repeat domain-containing protein [Thermodesulfovibrionales bacterium]
MKKLFLAVFFFSAFVFFSINAHAGPLHDAAWAGNIKKIIELLDKGADINAKDNNGWTALIWAAREGKTDAINFLINNGADVYVKDNMGWTALMRAVTNGHTSAIELLISKGVDVNARANDGWTALTEAAWYGHISVINILISKGADMDYAIIRLESQAIKDPERASSYKQVIALLEKLRPKKEMVSQQLPAQVVAKQDLYLATKSDIDELPAIKAKPNRNSYAIVIGIEQYRQKLPKADFAVNDAKIMTEYLTKAMGYPEENVVTLINDRALKSDMEKYFEKWLWNNVEKDSSVFIYYSGHGAPNPKTGDAYLVPYDGDPSFIAETGYSLKRLYENLGKLQAKEIVVALDSCFSGAGGRSVLAKGARPLVMTMENLQIPQKIAVLSATSGDQISSTYEEKGHGLFTYFMLKGLKGEGDTNGDGKVEIGELFEYIKPHVERIARRVYNNEQLPQLIAPAEIIRQKLIER